MPEPLFPPLPADASTLTARLLDALFEHATVGLAFWDCDLRYQRINDRLAAMNGVAAADHLGLRPTEVLPELGPRLERTLAEVVAEGVPLRDVDVSGETPAAPGLERHWHGSYYPARDEDGGGLGVAGLRAGGPGPGAPLARQLLPRPRRGRRRARDRGPRARGHRRARGEPARRRGPAAGGVGRRRARGAQRRAAGRRCVPDARSSLSARQR